ncbi:MAG: hypothetical protein K9I68_00195 [Bacteroidales bacterium]|nr:hypothetical protein [Bacteroidales bacterium]MCF8338102.1 hypothetical protein [Bacteroidales bacterium]
MYTINIDENLGNLLDKENIDAEKVLKEYLMLDLLNRKDKYDSIIKKFEKKYNGKFSEIEKQVHSMKNQEDFITEEDLMEWEFAEKGLQDIENYLKKIGSEK